MSDKSHQGNRAIQNGAISTIVRIPLGSAGRRTLFALACLIAVGFFVFAAHRPFSAELAARHLNAAGLRAATRLQPANATYQHQLGRQYFFMDQDALAAIEHYRAALDLNPRNARYWLDLATAYQFTGDTGAQRDALLRASQVDPTTPDVAWEAANLAFAQGETATGLRFMRVVIENDPENRRSALAVSWKATRDVKTLSENLPPNPDVYLQWLRLLVDGAQAEAAQEVWARVVSLGKPVSAKSTFSLVDYLLDSDRVPAATQVWANVGRLDAQFKHVRSSSNLVINSGFEEEILNGGFDWRWTGTPNVATRADDSVFRSGSRSLGLIFEGVGTAPDMGVFQFIPVEPNTEYEFSGYIKADTLESASGPRFAIMDLRRNPLLITDDVLGSSGWQERRGAFTTGRDTRLVVLKIVRQPNFPLVKGKVWIDDLAIVPK